MNFTTDTFMYYNLYNYVQEYIEVIQKKINPEMMRYGIQL